MNNKYICSSCKKEFEKAITDKEANKEAEELFGVKEASNRDDMAIVCDDCFNKIMKKEIYILQEALRDLSYNFLKSIGIIWLIKKISFLELKNWVREKDKKNKNFNLKKEQRREQETKITLL
ncbi:unnamed protein product [marine sediment metagenome]|uniref:Uncharacterized protein n=1 Tax=marine sediment metagenome TaxID=412755 RepID=X1LZG4_9ZZZZ